MLSPFKKKLIMGFIKRNIERGYIDLADSQISEHIEDFSEDDCVDLYGLIESKMTDLEAAVNVDADIDADVDVDENSQTQESL